MKWFEIHINAFFMIIVRRKFFVITVLQSQIAEYASKMLLNLCKIRLNDYISRLGCSKKCWNSIRHRDAVASDCVNIDTGGGGASLQPQRLLEDAHNFKVCASDASVPVPSVSRPKNDSAHTAQMLLLRQTGARTRRRRRSLRINAECERVRRRRLRRCRQYRWCVNNFESYLCFSYVAAVLLLCAGAALCCSSQYSFNVGMRSQTRVGARPRQRRTRYTHARARALTRTPTQTSTKLSAAAATRAKSLRSNVWYVSHTRGPPTRTCWDWFKFKQNVVGWGTALVCISVCV